MAVVRIEALQSLADWIVCGIPELEDRVCVGQASPPHQLAFPSLVIDPVRWVYHPFQADEVFNSAPDRVIMNVGCHVATVQLRLAHTTPYQRAALEQKVLDLFLETPLRPGVILTDVLTCDALGDFRASWELDEDEWDDAMAFDQEFYSMMACTGTIPALVTRGSSHTVDQLLLGVTEDFDSTITPTTFDTDPNTEIVQINQDGTLSAYP